MALALKWHPMNRQPSLFDTPPKPREMDLHPLRCQCRGRIATLSCVALTHPVSYLRDILLSG